MHTFFIRFKLNRDIKDHPELLDELRIFNAQQINDSTFKIDIEDGSVLEFKLLFRLFLRKGESVFVELEEKRVIL